MQSVLAWLKANVLIVVMAALVLILPPAGIVGASIWNTKIREAAEEAYKKEESALRAAREVTYVIPSITPGEEAVSITAAPNNAVTAFVKAERERRQAELERVVRAAVTFNQGEARDLLVRGLFPQPADERAGRDLVESLARTLVGTVEEASAYQRLFDAINAGMPPAEAAIARVVTDAEVAERERLLDASGSNDLTEDEARALRERLVGLRVSALRDRAAGISVYGSAATALGITPAVDPAAAGVPGGPGGWSAGGASSPGASGGNASGAGAVSASDLPESPRPVYPFDPAAERPGLGRAFIWQWDYWFVADLLAAVQAANTGPSGLTSDEPLSVVKRIESIRIDAPAKAGFVDAGGFGGSSYGSPSGFTDPGAGFDPAAAAPAEETGLVSTLAGALSHTGHTSSDTNQTYDVRTATMTVVAASSRLTRLLEALAAQNLMTVIGVQLSPVDVAADLASGYFYGDEHVIRAEIRVESVWLRLWTVDLMPASLKRALGVQEPAAPAEGEVQP